MTVVAASKSRKAAYFLYGCQKFYIYKLVKEKTEPVSP
jgi:hypothetical protein